LMILEVFSNLNDSMILFGFSSAVKTWYEVAGGVVHNCFLLFLLHSIWISFRKQAAWHKTVCHSLSLTTKTEGKELPHKSAIP